jgi:hypothetical protein
MRLRCLRTALNTKRINGKTAAAGMAINVALGKNDVVAARSVHTILIIWFKYTYIIFTIRKIDNKIRAGN